MTDITAQNGLEAYRTHALETFGRYAAVVEECEHLKKELERCQSVIARAEVQLSSYKQQVEMMIANHLEEIEMMRNDRRNYQLERDQAVAERAKYESLFIGLHAQLHAFKLPAAPLIKEIEGETSL